MKWKMNQISIKHITRVLSFIILAIALSGVSSLVLHYPDFDDDLQLSKGIGDAQHGDILTDVEGNKHIVWQDNRTGNFQLYYNRIDQERFVLYPDDLQLTFSPSTSQNPALALDDYGYLHLCWQDDRDGNWEIYYKKLDMAGHCKTGDERVTNDPAASLQPQIACDSDGDVHLSWYDNRSGEFEIYWDTRIESDLQPTAIDYSPPLFVDDEVTFSCTIENIGNNSAYEIDIDFLIDESIVDSTTISTLDAYSLETIYFYWTAVYGNHLISVEVDPENLIAERNEANNIMMSYESVYQITEFVNSSIPASALVTHSIDGIVTMLQVDDPNPFGTEGSFDLFVDYSIDTYFSSAQIKINYEPSQLGDIEEASLQMYEWDIYSAQGERWILLEESGVNINDNYVWANVTHFSIFAPLGEEITNQPPSPPAMPSGLSSIYAGYSWNYTTNTTDPEGHDIFYKWDWGDGNISDWIGPFTSGTIDEESHIWTIPSTYDIKVKAKDDPDGDGDPVDGLESDWSEPLQVTVKKPGDVDGSGVVNVLDLLNLLGSWGEQGGPADINGDGIVNVLDLLILLGNWG